MKGLLIKDLYTFVSYGKMLIVLALIFMFIGTAEQSFMMVFPILYAAMISMNTLAYDERGHWEAYADALPVTRKDVVVSKYLLPVFAIIIMTVMYGVLSILLWVAQGASADSALSPGSIFNSMLEMFSAGMFFTAVMYPLVFKLGVEKGRMAYIVLLAVVAGGIGAAAFTDISTYEITVKLSDTLLMAGISILVLLASVAMSVRFYTKREL